MSWGYVAVAAGAVVSGAMQSNATKKAAASQTGAADEAAAVSARQADLARSDLSSYRMGGNAAIGRLRELTGIAPGAGNVPKGTLAAMIRNLETYNLQPYYRQISDDEMISQFRQHAPIYLSTGKTLGGGEPLNSQQLESIRNVYDQLPAEADAGAAPSQDTGDLNRKFSVADFYDDPVSQLSLKYGLDLGTKAIDNMAASRGMRNSGATLKELTRFGEDYAGSKANEAYNRFEGEKTSQFNRLASIAGLGQTATNTGVNAGAVSATNLGNILTQAGNVRGAAAINQGNAGSGAINTIANWYQQQKLLDQLKSGSSSPNNGTYYIEQS